MEELIEGVLAIRAWLAEDQRPGGAHHRRAVHPHALAVRFHVELLEIGGQPLQPLLVGKHSVGRVAPDVAVPDTDEAKDRRQVAVERLGAKMVVHRPPAGQEAAEAGRTDGDH